MKYYIIKVKTKNRLKWYYQFELAGELQVTNSKKRASKFNERRVKELVHKLRSLFPSEEFKIKVFTPHKGNCGRCSVLGSYGKLINDQQWESSY